MITVTSGSKRPCTIIGILDPHENLCGYETLLLKTPESGSETLKNNVLNPSPRKSKKENRKW